MWEAVCVDLVDVVGGIRILIGTINVVGQQRIGQIDLGQRHIGFFPRIVHISGRFADRCRNLGCDVDFNPVLNVIHTIIVEEEVRSVSIVTVIGNRSYFRSVLGQHTMTAGLHCPIPAIGGVISPRFRVIPVFVIAVISEVLVVTIRIPDANSSTGGATVILSLSEHLTSATEVIRIDAECFVAPYTYIDISVGVNLAGKGHRRSREQFQIVVKKDGEVEERISLYFYGSSQPTGGLADQHTRITFSAGVDLHDPGV